MIPDRFADVLRVPEVQADRLPEDGPYPNNPDLPLLVYTSAFRSGVLDPAAVFEEVFRAHEWWGAWRNGIFSYHHYHSTTHEVLGVARGSASVRLGGPSGLVVDASAGDVLILPAGVAHKNEGSSPDFLVVGAYPQGREWDLKTGDPSERPEADRNIEAVPRPALDPVYGDEGPLRDHWANPPDAASG